MSEPFGHSISASSVSQLRISRYDRKPLSSVDLKHSAVVQINQITSVKNAEPTALILPVSEDGDVRIRFKLQAQVVTLFIQVSNVIFQHAKVDLQNNHSSVLLLLVRVSVA